MPNETRDPDQVQLDELKKRLERKTKEVEIIQQVSSQINAILDLKNSSIKLNMALAIFSKSNVALICEDTC